MKKGKTLSVTSDKILVGDSLAAFLKPSVERLKKLTGVDLTNCEGCSHTREALGTSEKRPSPPIV